MKSKNTRNLLTLCLLISLAAAGQSCKHRPVENSSPDPQSVKLLKFFPDSGGIRTRFIINGVNFGTLLDRVQVYFESEDPDTKELLSVPATMLGVKNEAIYGMVPKLSNGYKTIRVSVDGHDSYLGEGDQPKPFRYIVAKNVSTVVGKAKEGGNKNGSIPEATFGEPRYVSVDAQGNLFVTDAYFRTLRQVSTSENFVKQLFAGDLLGQSCSDKARENFFVLSDGEKLLYRYSGDIGYALEKKGKVLSTNLFMHSLTFGPEKDSVWLYSRYNTGKFIRFPFKKGIAQVSPNEVQELGHIGDDNNGQNGHMLYNPVDGYIYCVVHRNSALYRIKVTPKENTLDMPEVHVEKISGSGTYGYEDGEISTDGSSAIKFNQPRGIAISKNGNVYIADTGNHCIRMLNIKTGVVSTVAGVPKKPGYLDGDPEEALFNQPWGITFDENDFLYIADTKNHCVRKLAIE